eukprot:4216698-Lingulodinium_polyedra.AAC.1
MATRRADAARRCRAPMPRADTATLRNLLRSHGMAARRAKRIPQNGRVWNDSPRVLCTEQLLPDLYVA